MPVGAPSRLGPAAADSGLPYRSMVMPWLPGMRRAFLPVNRWLAVPVLRAGLGPLLATPLTGSLMVLRTRGRTSGRWRSAPLGYVIRDGQVYCCAGFGQTTQWLRNLQHDPRVELLLPGRSVAGLASVVDDPAERGPALRALLGSMPAISRPLVGRPGALTPAELEAMAAALPVVRIRVTGLAAGPWDPGGHGWVLGTGLGTLLIGRWAWRHRRRASSRC